MPAPRILVFAGSLRRDSHNKRLARIAADGARAAGAAVTLVDLRDLPMPLYDADLEAEQGQPANAATFRALMRDSQGLIIASPEYNSSIPAVLKNAIDWATRDERGEGSLAALEGKVAALLSASPGALGGLRGLVTLRLLLGNLKILVLPEQVTVPKADEAFAADGTLRDAKRQAAVVALAAQLVRTVGRLAAE